MTFPEFLLPPRSEADILAQWAEALGGIHDLEAALQEHRKNKPDDAQLSDIEIIRSWEAVTDEIGQSGMPPTGVA